MTNRITGKLIPKDNRNVQFHADLWPDKPIDYEDITNKPSINRQILGCNYSNTQLGFIPLNPIEFAGIDNNGYARIWNPVNYV